jgi:prevent-host-death family protein
MESTMSVTDVRRNFGKLLDRVDHGERIVITRYGKPLVACVPISDLRLLKQAESKFKKPTSK